MSYKVELLDAGLAPIGEARDIVAVAAAFLDRYLGRAWRHPQLDQPILLLLPYPGEDNALPGDPPIRYGSEAIGYIQLQIAVAGHALYRHPHSVAEVLGPGVRDWVAGLPDPSRVLAYRLGGPGLDRLASRSAPIPRGVAEIAPYAQGEGPAFRIRPLPPAPPPPRTLAQLGARAPDPDFAQGPHRTDLVKVVMEPALAADLGRRPFSDRVEQGGFLVGEVYADAQAPGTHIALIAAAIPAEQVGASFLHFTFTGDSFEGIKARLAGEHRGRTLLGWYHTHLFPATEAIGLSSIDYRLHFTTFRIPWQVAGLLNLDGADRVLRYYVRQGDEMRLCHHQTRRPEAADPDTPAGPAAEAP